MKQRISAVLVVLLSTGCAGAEPEPGPSSAEAGAEDPIFELERVTDGVYATPVRDGVSPSQFALSVIVIREDHVVVVDSRQGPSAARRLIATIRGLTALPVRYLVNTHWHGDHVQGNEAFRAEFPGVQIVAGFTTDEDMAELGRARLDEEIERGRARLAATEDRLASGIREDGGPLTESETEQLADEILQLEAYLSDRADLTLVGPDLIVEDELTLGHQSPAVRVLRVGPAHTRGDVVVQIPELEVLAIGDLLEDGFPWFGDGYPSGWATALDRIAELGARVVLPAHGPVLRGPEMFETQHRFVRTLAELARDAVERDEGAAEALARARHLDDFEAHFTRRLDGLSAEDRERRYDAFVSEALERALAEARGDLATS